MTVCCASARWNCVSLLSTVSEGAGRLFSLCYMSASHLVSPPHSWDCAGRHCRPRCKIMYECSVLGELDSLYKLTGLQVLPRDSNEDTSKRQNNRRISQGEQESNCRHPQYSFLGVVVLLRQHCTWCLICTKAGEIDSQLFVLPKWTDGVLYHFTNIMQRLPARKNHSIHSLTGWVAKKQYVFLCLILRLLLWPPLSTSSFSSRCVEPASGGGGGLPWRPGDEKV